ncbi:hypothetical protein C8J23_13834 [Shewanella chilikensis]|uniref:Uncharacterized protein n=1 Tax=Shewanella chilikensis TaxID=558541 RepID=A0ABX5PJ43_9GAMM|nr:hypothetical protein [Shewanella chilikensis]MCL1152991.1 hypothetical protein [Shewanella chilikensis]PYE55555.1 hypothetical protein C8J23_13834 [Shewanella chilikensis]GGZ42730.1 hypothetical protein GCM10007105_31960 [Shewanella chilikensis]
MSTSIHTIDARGHIMLETMRDYFGLSPEVMFREIQGMVATTIDILNSKGIKYQDLRTALVPRTDRFEAGFIFDSQDIESSWYGLEVMKQVLPLLDLKSNHSVQCGDLIGNDQEFIFSVLQESLVLSRDLEFVHGTVLYCVYINNLTESGLERIHKSLSQFKPYVGFIPGTFSSRARIYLSTILANSFLKHGKKVIMGHEDDRPNEENINMAGYPFADYGLEVYSLQSMYFDVLLSYKIERPIFKGFESDTELSLNAISDQIFPIDGFEIKIEDAKYEYLKSAKCGKLEKAGIESLDKEDISDLIRSKVSDSYIYNLSYLPDHNVSKFNVMIEIPRPDGSYPTRVVTALEYKPQEKVLRVITMH